MFFLGIPNKPSIEHVRKHHHCEGVAFSSLCRTEEERLSTHSISLDIGKKILSFKQSTEVLPAFSICVPILRLLKEHERKNDKVRCGR